MTRAVVPEVQFYVLGGEGAQRWNRPLKVYASVDEALADLRVLYHYPTMQVFPLMVEVPDGVTPYGFYPLVGNGAAVTGMAFDPDEIYEIAVDSDEEALRVYQGILRQRKITRLKGLIEDARADVDAALTELADARIKLTNLEARLFAVESGNDEPEQ